MTTTDAARERRSALLSQADIARLARVERPVVSVWASRYPEQSEHPFPTPVRTRGQQKFFTRESIARWLEHTKLGNNVDAAREALAYSAPRLTGPDAHRAAAALLTLSVLTGESLVQLDAEDLQDLADEIDPRDEFLRAEIDALDAEDLDELAPYVQARLSASMGAAQELRSLELDAAHFGTSQRPRELTDDALALVHRLTSALAGVLGPEGAVALAARLRDAELLRLNDESWPGARVILTDGEGEPDEEDRAVRRRLKVCGADNQPVFAAADSLSWQDHPSIVVCTFSPSDVRGGEALIEQIEQWTGRLGDHQVAVVLGAAEHLTDTATYAPHMAYALSRGYLRAAVRLGAGVWRANPNAHGALWVLGHPRPSKEHKNLVLTTADLAGRSLTDVADPLVVDLLASLVDLGPAERRRIDGPGGTRGHVHHLATTELLADVLDEARHSLVVRDAAPHLTVRPMTASQEDALARLATDAALPLPGFAADAVPAPQGRAPSFGTTTETLGALTTRVPASGGGRGINKRVHVLTGLRLDSSLDTAAATGPAVVGPSELADESRIGRRRVDLLALTSTHPHHQLTEPGDVVVTTSPAPAAWVDLDGGNVVVFPARTLRITEAGRTATPQRLVPHILAADLRRMPGKDWRSTRVRLLPADLAERFEADATAAHRARAAALTRAGQLADLVDLMADGVAGGSLTYPNDTYPNDTTDPTDPLAEGD